MSAAAPRSGKGACCPRRPGSRVAQPAPQAAAVRPGPISVSVTRGRKLRWAGEDLRRARTRGLQSCTPPHTTLGAGRGRRRLNLNPTGPLLPHGGTHVPAPAESAWAGWQAALLKLRRERNPLSTSDASDLSVARNLARISAEPTRPP